MKRKFYTILGIAALFAFNAQSQIITTIAGKDRVPGYLGDNGASVNAQVWGPAGIARDKKGNIYIADQYNHRIRKIGTDGVIVTIAGKDSSGFSGDGGLATAAKLNEPRAVALDASGNIYFSDGLNNRIRRIDTAGIITTVAGTGSGSYNGDNILATSAALQTPRGLTFDAAGNLYIADAGNNRVRRIDRLSGVITTIAGTGTAAFNSDAWPSATQASLNNPTDVLVDASGNIYIADAYNHRIRKIDETNRISTIAGTVFGYEGQGTPAVFSKLNRPTALAMDQYKNLYFTDMYNNSVRKIDASGKIYTVAGTGAAGHEGDSVRGSQAELTHPQGIAVDSGGTIYFGEWSNNRVRKITTTVSVGEVEQLSGNITVFPNPSANGHFTFSLNASTTEELNIAVVDVTGRSVKTFTGYANRPVEFALDVPAGVYYIVASSAKGRWTGELQVVR